MKFNCAVIVLASLVTLVGCVTPDVNTSVTILQSSTSKMLGLASSDEIVITKVNAGTADTLGNQALTYTATTARGRIYDCTATLRAGFLMSPPTVSNPTCTPVVAHSNQPVPSATPSRKR